MNLTTNTDGAKVLECREYKDRTIIIAVDNICSIPDGFDRAFSETLTKSLKTKGMINPILVCTEKDFQTKDIRKFERRKVPETVEVDYRCLIGNNRYKFAVENGYTHIECLVVSGYDEARSLTRETEIPPRKM